MTTDTTPGTDHADRQRRFRKLADQGAIEAIRKRCEQLRTETEDGLVLHAANDIEQQGEMLYRHINDLQAEHDALDAARRDAEARAQRLRELADARGVLLSLASPPACVRSLPRATTLPQWLDAMERHARAETDCRKHGDLDAEPAPARADGGA